jgi:hypothetical protein
MVVKPVNAVHCCRATNRPLSGVHYTQLHGISVAGSTIIFKFKLLFILTDVY